ncbi:hypothetical protein [Octadecabacter ascidiaceicola]|uniref:Uncharacterized protein n=1 Tax=Octadecabacter ascidiaceicola TaxID=1655543 RepID=A0A238KS44_9RHOB|nr:hypothetical protein [Octadecabacter ascidiaceicola]SMX45507.1 hypothetical protein OCA8868_03317 [Octadecabacter ascidiaceicola]
MDPLILYPSQDRLKVAMIAAAVMVGLPFLIGSVGLGVFIPFYSTLALFAMGGGVVLFINVMKMKARKEPTFAADAMGFSIRGGRKQSWDEFKGADTYPFDTAIKLGVGNSALKPNVEIKTLELSGPARLMVEQIEQYAAQAKRAAVMGNSVTLGATRDRRANILPATLEEAVRVLPPEQKAKADETGFLPIELYPGGTGRRNALIGAGGALFFALQLGTWTRADSLPYLMWVFLGLAVMTIVPTILTFVQPVPSFAADREGFSVKGKPKKGWDEFKGVKVQTVRYLFFPLAKNVIIKTGKTVLGRSYSISRVHQSGPAEEMAAEIAAYARAAQLAPAPRVAHADVRMEAPRPVQQPVFAPEAVRPEPLHDFGLRPKQPQSAAQPVTKQSDPLMARVQGAGGAIESVPSLGERIFGRRKVI